MKRRDFLARQGLFLAALAGAGLLPPLAGRPMAHAQSANVTLKFLGWQGYDDQKAMAPLSAQGLTLDAQYVTGNAEIVTKLRSGGVGSIDVVTPGISAIKPLILAKLIQPIDFAKMPSAAKFFAQFRSLDWQQSNGQDFAAPVMWSDYPISYRADLFKDLPKTWASLGDEKYRGRLVTLDEPANLWVFAKSLFGTSNFASLTKAQVEETVKAYLPIKKNLVAISPSYGDIVDVLARGDAHASVLGWRFIEVQLKKKGLQGASFVPEDGTFLWCDSYCIASEAPHLAETYTFINQMLSPEANALIAAGTGSGVVNADSVGFLPEDQRQLYPYGELDAFLSKNSFYIPPQLEAEGDIATMRDWTEAWDRIKLS
jgi:spermidine/putrescine transport system substrate-binding protein